MRSPIGTFLNMEKSMLTTCGPRKTLRPRLPNAPEGTPVAQPAVIKEPVAGTMYNRSPDLVLKMSDSFLVKGDGGERFIVF